MRINTTIGVAALAALFLGAPGAVSAAPLADASETADWSRVAGLLSAGSEVGEAQADGTTALIWAAYHRNSDLVRELLERGADPNATNRYGLSALSQAALVGEAELIGVLLEHGADPNAALPEGDTPLMLAARSGSLESARLLLDAGADVAAREGHHGETALMWAAGENHADIVSLLLERDADVDAVSTEFTWDLTQTGVSSELPIGGLTALMHAARENAIDAARVLLDAGADPNTTDPRGLSVLRVAITNTNVDLGMMLLDAGADPNEGALVEAIKLRTIFTPRAAKDRIEQATPMDMIVRLLDAGADIEFVPEEGMVKQMWIDDVHPNEKPLYLAAQEQDIELMELLIGRGADAATTVSSEGMSILWAALGMDQHNGNGGMAIPRPDMEHSLRAGAFALEHGAPVDTTNNWGETALHMAATLGWAELVPFLLEHGAPLDVMDDNNRLPIHGANAIPRFMNEMLMPLRVDPVVYPEILALIRDAMAAAGVEETEWVAPPPPEPEEETAAEATEVEAEEA